MTPPLHDAERLARATALHEETFGCTPAAVAFAPGRVNLIGEHTDYNGGLSMPIAIDRGTTCAVSPRADGVIAVRSAQGDRKPSTIAMADMQPSAVRGWLAYAVGAVALATRNSWHHGGVSVTVDGDVPLGAGLSSSASLECSVLLALATMSQSTPGPIEIALAAQAAEHEFAGVPCGILDQATAMLAREGEALLLDSQALAASSVPLHLDDLGLRLLVVDTRARHQLGDGGYADRREACEEAARRLGVRHLAALDVSAMSRIGELPEPWRRRARHVVTENARVLLAARAFEAGDRAALGRLFAASHASLAVDFEVSCPELDAAVTAAVDAGAVAARMTGGGFGGSVAVLVDGGRVDEVRDAVAQAFVGRGFAAPSFLDVRPSAGAHALVP